MFVVFIETYIQMALDRRYQPPPTEVKSLVGVYSLHAIRNNKPNQQFTSVSAGADVSLCGGAIFVLVLTNAMSLL